MPSRTFHSDPIGDVWYDSAGAGGVASYGSPDPNNEQDLRVVTFMGSIYAQHNAIRYSYGILRTRVVIPATRGLCPRLELSLAATTSSEKFRIPTVIKTRE